MERIDAWKSFHVPGCDCRFGNGHNRSIPVLASHEHHDVVLDQRGVVLTDRYIQRCADSSDLDFESSQDCREREK
jgi:hypothetical protein